jgi:LysM repeat protein
MIGTVFRFIWVMWVTLVCVHYCSMQHYPAVQSAYGNDWSLEETMGVIPVKKAPPPNVVTTIGEYTVVAGDTLGDIATRYGTTWEKLWSINRDRITDPNLIHVGQKIRIGGKSQIPVVVLTREQKIDKVVRFMFKTSQVPFEEKGVLEARFVLDKTSLFVSKTLNLDDQRGIATRIYATTRQLEIYELATAIVDTAGDDSTLCKLVGLAWQETQFVNRLGRAGEVSFFQFLPSTIRERFQLDDIGLVNKLWELKNNPKKATELALEMMTEYRWQSRYWNQNLTFEYQLNNKIYWFQHEWRK